MLYLKQEKYEQAIAIFKKAIEVMPNYVLAMSNLAEAYSKLGDKKNTCLTLKRMADLGNEKAIAYFEQYCK